MYKHFVQPYKMASSSAKAIASALNLKRIRIDKDTYKPKQSHLVLNWGSSIQYPFVRYINYPFPVSTASDKLHTFERFKNTGITTVNWTTKKEEAANLLASGKTVLARKLLNSCEGKGIEVCIPGTELPDAPLYTEYKKKSAEFRVHVFDGVVIDVQQKRKRSGYEGETNQYVRSYRYGWVFCRENVLEPAGIRDLAIKAVKALGLDFGAVDIIWNKAENKCYVLEINTAPGIEGQTVESYTNAIKAYLQKQEDAIQTNTPATTVSSL